MNPEQEWMDRTLAEANAGIQRATRYFWIGMALTALALILTVIQAAKRINEYAHPRQSKYWRIGL